MNRVVAFATGWPPSVNHYWGARGKGRYVKREGLAYRSAVVSQFYAMREQGFGSSKVRVRIQACAPDKRRRDLDNVLKAALDSMAHARVFNDDSQVTDLRIWWGPPAKGGQLMIEVEEA